MTMPAHSDPRADLLQAFLQTEYVILPRANAIDIRIGQCHRELDSILQHRPWAVVTAYNPGGVAADAEANERRHQRLLAAIADAGLNFRPGCNRDPLGDWPDEPSLFIIDAESGWLVTLARRLGQLALVAGQPDRPAELWLVDGDWPDPLPGHVRRIHA